MMMGMTEEQFWHSNPRKLIPYSIVYERRQFQIDRWMHAMGAYVYEAVGTVMANAFSKHSNKSYRDKPHMAEEEERLRNERMTEEEKIEKVEEIFAMLSSTGQK